jgi:hypothetical protein
VRLFRPIIFILFSNVDRVEHQFPTSDWITSQLVRHDHPGLIATRPQQPIEKACCSNSISPGLQKNINHLTILINGSPKIALLAVYLHEDFVDVEGVTESSVSLLQSTCVFGSELLAGKI